MATTTPVAPAPLPYTVAPLPVMQIHIDDAIQPRTGLSEIVVHEYATLYAESEDTEPLPPLDVFQIERRYYVADGFHRLAAAKEAKRKEVVCHVYTGTQPEAMRHAAFANLRRGLAYSQHDRQRILERLLQDPEASQRSNRDLAQVLGLSHVTVGRARQRLATIATLEAEWQVLPEPQTMAPRTEQIAAFLGTDIHVVHAYLQLGDGRLADVLTTVARRMTDLQEDETTAKAALSQHITWEVRNDEQRRALRKAQRPPRTPKPPPETPEQQAAREAEEQRQAREGRLFESLTRLVETFDEAALRSPSHYFTRYTRAEMVQAVAPRRRPELRALLEQAAATVQALTALFDADAEANLQAVAAGMNERLKQIPYTRVKAKKETATG